MGLKRSLELLLLVAILTSGVASAYKFSHGDVVEVINTSSLVRGVPAGNVTIREFESATMLGSTSLSSAQPVSVGDRIGVTKEGDGVRVRKTPGLSGEVITTRKAGQEGEVIDGPQFVDGLKWWNVYWSDGMVGWTAEGQEGSIFLQPMPGKGKYPSVTIPSGQAYRVVIYKDGSGVNVREGPGLNWGTITTRSVGDSGWAFEVSVNRVEGLVWWRIRWDDGIVGWTADSQLSYGVYLVEKGTASVRSLTVSSSNPDSGVSITVSPTDLEGNSGGSTAFTRRYIHGTQVTLTAQTTAPNGNQFVKWLRNNIDYSTSNTVQVTMDSDLTFTAVYKGNQKPVAYIDSISPNPAKQGETVYFKGHGTDPDGDSIVAYRWRSSINGDLSTSASFSRSDLSVGTHTIYFKVQDSRGLWSDEVSTSLRIDPKDQTGTINVNTNLDCATFTIIGPKTYHGSGRSWSVSGAPPGTYRIVYEAVVRDEDGKVVGYDVPKRFEEKTLVAGGSITFEVEYIRNTPPTSGKISWFVAPQGGAWGEPLGEDYGTDEATKYWYVAMRWPYAKWDYQTGKAVSSGLSSKADWHNKKVVVTNPKNGKQVVLAAKDWGPAPWTGRVIDVSKTALEAIGAVTDDIVNIEFADQNAPLGPIGEAFKIGDWVQTSDELNVRKDPRIAPDNVIWTAPKGSIGIIIDGPQSESGYTWWKIRYDYAPPISGYEYWKPSVIGWSSQHRLEKISTPSQPPRFLTLPFKDPDIKIQQGWVYTFNPDDPNAHKGIDYIKGDIDQPASWQSFDVVAAADGWAMWSEQPGDTGVYGKFILIQHQETDFKGNRYFTLYAHLDSVAPGIPYQDRNKIDYDISDPSKWKFVKRGEVIGRAGNTGASNTGIHLHFEVQRRAYAHYKTDPYDLYETRYSYPVQGGNPSCGSRYLWTTDPPSLGDVETYPKPVISVSDNNSEISVGEIDWVTFTVTNIGTEPTSEWGIQVKVGDGLELVQDPSHPWSTTEPICGRAREWYKFTTLNPGDSASIRVGIKGIKSSDYESVWYTAWMRDPDGKPQTWQYSHPVYSVPCEREYAEYVVKVVTSNRPPQLSNGYVTPESGDTSTDFYWYVTYFDPDGDSPSVKQVYIDGVPYDMSWYSGLDSQITYRYGPEKLSAGTHSYYFYFEDGKGGIVRLPPSGSYSGPTVITPPKPDLTVTAIKVDPYPPRANEVSTVTATIENIGSGSAGSFYVYFYVNNNLISKKTVPLLAAGANTPASFSWTPTAAGTYTLKVIADSDNAVAESNEANNEKSIVVTVTSTTPTSTVYIEPNVNEAAPGREFTVSIYIQSDTPVKSVLVNFTFNNQLVSYISGSTMRLFDFTDTIAPGADYVKFLGVDRDGVNVAAKTKIAEVKFKVRDAAQEGSVITFSATANVDGSEAEVVVGAVTVEESIIGAYDENNNGRIDDEELIAGIMDWLNGSISDLELIEVIMSWLG